jgi:serine/threonine protein phosphatase PrpC
MEDAHIANLDIGDGVAIFGVFDGHGGKNIFISYISQ